MADAHAHEAPPGARAPQPPRAEAPHSAPPVPAAPAVPSPEQIAAAIRQEVARQIQAQQNQSQTAERPGRVQAVSTPQPENTVNDSEKITLPGFTEHAMDKTLLSLTKEYLEGDAGKGWGRGVLPLAVGTAVEWSRPNAGVVQTVFDAFYTGPLSGMTKVASDAAFNIGNALGVARDLQGAVGTFVAAGNVAALATGILSPSISIAKRVLMGVKAENAFRQASRYMLKKDHNFIDRIVRGPESWLLKKSMMSEDKYVKKLVKWIDDKEDINNLVIGSQNEVYNLMASGVMAEAKARLLTEMGANLSSEEIKRMDKMHEVYNLAQKVFDAKVTRPDQRERFTNTILPNMFRSQERKLWAKNTALLTAAGVGKAVSMVGLLQIVNPVTYKAAFAWGQTAWTNATAWVATQLGIPAAAAGPAILPGKMPPAHVGF